MSFKFQQVLRTKVPVTVDGIKVAPRTRVVVMKAAAQAASKVKVRVDDKNHPELTGKRFEVGVGALTETHRGRPAGSKKAAV